MKFNLVKFLNLPLFFISFLFGILCVYMISPDMRKIYVYPTHDNVDLIQYKDNADNCFNVKETKTSCSKDALKLKPQV